MCSICIQEECVNGFFGSLRTVSASQNCLHTSKSWEAAWTFGNIWCEVNKKMSSKNWSFYRNNLNIMWQLLQNETLHICASLAWFSFWCRGQSALFLSFFKKSEPFTAGSKILCKLLMLTSAAMEGKLFRSNQQGIKRFHLLVLFSYKQQQQRQTVKATLRVHRRLE